MSREPVEVDASQYYEEKMKIAQAVEAHQQEHGMGSVFGTATKHTTFAERLRRMYEQGRPVKCPHCPHTLEFIKYRGQIVARCNDCENVDEVIA